MALCDYESDDQLEVAIRREVKIRQHLHLRDCGERQLTDFSSNDFLSLASNAALGRRFLQRLTSMDSPIMGSSGSRLLVPAPHHIALEAKITKMWTLSAKRIDGVSRSRLDALFFPSGYCANLGFWSTVPQDGDVVLYDEFIHASVLDGLRLGRVGRGLASAKRFLHNDLVDLDRILQEDAESVRAGKTRDHNVLVAVETLYSMEGDITNLSGVLAVVRPFGKRVKVVVDEAHALGVFHLGLSMPPYMKPEEASEVFARTITFGKGPGVAGAAMVVPDYVKPYLVATARSFIFSTAPTVFSVVAVDCALETLDDGTATALAKKLQENIRTLLFLLHKHLSGIPASIASVPIPAPSSRDTAERSPVVPILTPHGEAHAIALGAHLRLRCGAQANPVGYPAVARDATRIRVCVNAGHSHDQLKALAHGVGEWAHAQLTTNAKL
ncbi:PLP-dependent transferase [Auriculariales sp. MPI-PUGE-AT-0066]|nr:PLP-dependent transferase [Auriculariales sp. MPI-PUGE-AT-0066]